MWFARGRRREGRILKSDQSVHESRQIDRFSLLRVLIADN